MPRLTLFILLFSVCLAIKADEVTITPSEVYAQVLLIEKETELVKRYFNSTKQATVITEVNFETLPRHVWQKGYMLQMKLVAFRRNHQLGAVAPVGIEPRKEIGLRNAWSQTQRSLTEIRIIRNLLGIKGEVGVVPHVEGKKTLDVFNKLAQLEAEWDTMAGGAGFDPSHAFAQALRLNEDVNMILQKLDVFDNAIPPAKTPASTPSDSLAQAFLVLEQVQRLQKLANLEIADLSAFRKTEKATPADVFNLVCLILPELQQIKYKIGLKYAITPAATYHEGKKPADTRQLLGYITHKLALIEHL
jgi:hypothetical protein